MLDKIYKKGWLHVDAKPENVMCNKSGNLVLIDFGWAVKRTGDSSNHPMYYSPPYRNELYNFKDFKKLQEENFKINFE